MNEKPRRRPVGPRLVARVRGEVLPPFRYDPANPPRSKATARGFRLINDRKRPS